MVQDNSRLPPPPGIPTHYSKRLVLLLIHSRLCWRKHDLVKVHADTVAPGQQCDSKRRNKHIVEDRILVNVWYWLDYRANRLLFTGCKS